MDPRERAHERMLALRCQAGDEDAFIQLFKRYQGPLKYYVRGFVDSPESADDVLQTTWLKVLRGFKNLRDTGAIRAWLYRVARNEALQYLRRNGNNVTLAEDVPIEAQPNEEPDFADEDTARVHVALARLSPTHRDVLSLRFLEEMSYEEIASIAGCEVGTVRSRIYYAKRALRGILEEMNYDGQ